MVGAQRAALGGLNALVSLKGTTLELTILYLFILGLHIAVVDATLSAAVSAIPIASLFVVLSVASAITNPHFDTLDQLISHVLRHNVLWDNYAAIVSVVDLGGCREDVIRKHFVIRSPSVPKAIGVVEKGKRYDDKETCEQGSRFLSHSFY